MVIGLGAIVAIVVSAVVIAVVFESVVIVQRGGIVEIVVIFEIVDCLNG